MWLLRSMHERISFNVYRHLENILTILRKYDIPATFFITGEMAKKHPRVPQRIFKHEHEIASHGYSHRNVSEANYVEVESEISKSLAILKEFQDVRGFRAPFLARNKVALTACEKLGILYDSSEYGLTKYQPEGLNIMVIPIIYPADTHGLDFTRMKSRDLVAEWLLQCDRAKGAALCMHIWRVGRKRHIKAILEPLLRSDLFFVRASDLLSKEGVALTFDVEYASFGESMPSLSFRKMNVRNKGRAVR